MTLFITKKDVDSSEGYLEVVAGSGVTIEENGTNVIISASGGGGEAFPIGSVYFNVTGVDPGTELGYGDWTLILQGQFLVGYKSGDPDFGTIEGTGGSKTHAHTAHGTQNVKSGAGATVVNSGTHNSPSHLPPFGVLCVWKRTA